MHLFITEAIEAFNLFDRDDNNGIDIDELARVFRAVGQNPSDSELREIMKKHDLNRKYFQLYIHSFFHYKIH